VKLAARASSDQDDDNQGRNHSKPKRTDRITMQVVESNSSWIIHRDLVDWQDHGSSQGAHAINEAMVAALPDLNSLKSVLRVTHQTGEKDFEATRAAYLAAGWNERVNVTKYIDNMVAAFADADLVICRAGATTTAEIIAAAKAAIMIPFPFAADDHQRKNAEALERAGAGRMILQQNLSGENLAREIAALVREPERISAMEQGARKLARGDAAAVVVDLIEELVGNKKVDSGQ